MIKVLKLKVDGESDIKFFISFSIAFHLILAGSHLYLRPKSQASDLEFDFTFANNFMNSELDIRKGFL